MNENIVMYGADWCGDCRRSKAFLERRGVPFTYVDLEERPDQIDEVIRRNDGKRSIPVIVFDDGSHLTEPSNDDLAAKLGL
jgi:mycoredoxin